MLQLASAALPKVLALRFNSVCTCIQYLVNYAFIVLAVALVNAPTYSLTGQRAFHKTGFALIATYSSAIVGKVLYLDFRQVITEGNTFAEARCLKPTCRSVCFFEIALMENRARLR